MQTDDARTATFDAALEKIQRAGIALYEVAAVMTNNGAPEVGSLLEDISTQLADAYGQLSAL